MKKYLFSSSFLFMAIVHYMKRCVYVQLSNAQIWKKITLFILSSDLKKKGSQLTNYKKN